MPASAILSAVDGTAYVVSAEAFILWLPRLQIGMAQVKSQVSGFLL